MRTIAFTTNLHPDESATIAAAAALAVASKAKLYTVHATAGGPPASELPHPELLARGWGHTIEVEQLVHTCCDDVTDTLLDALRRIGPQLVVAGTHQRGNLSQLLSGSVAESVARNVAVPTLVIPLEGRSLVDPSTGALNLRRILVPQGDLASTRAGLSAADWLLRATGAPVADTLLLHVDDGTPITELEEAPPTLRVLRRTLQGGLEHEITKAVSELDACLVVMATRGHNGVIDTLLGSHTERVLRAVRCPVLVVPVGAQLH
jgi:nucleotide-binding universal stress UspA family protein